MKNDKQVNLRFKNPNEPPERYTVYVNGELKSMIKDEATMRGWKINLFCNYIIGIYLGHRARYNEPEIAKEMIRDWKKTAFKTDKYFGLSKYIRDILTGYFEEKKEPK